MTRLEKMFLVERGWGARAKALGWKRAWTPWKAGWGLMSVRWVVKEGKKLRKEIRWWKLIWEGARKELHHW